MQNASTPQKDVKFHLPVFPWLKTQEHCSACGRFLGARFGVSPENKKVCYACCGKQDEKMLLNASPGDKFVLYFDGTHVLNWPGSFKIRVFASSSRHNYGGMRHDFHFTVGAKRFHGYQIGDSNEIAHIRCLKK